MRFGGEANNRMARVRSSIAIGFACIAASLMLVGNAAASGPFPITERFDSTSWGDFNHAGSAQLTAADGIDPDGEGWLRLNDNSYQLGYVWSDAAFPSSQGWSVEFEYAMWGTIYEEPADGISFFLFDASVPQFQIGVGGGGLGYSGDPFGGEDFDGVAGGVLGIGLDAWGNFSRNTGEPLVRGQVAVRGPQSSGYRLLAARKVDGGLLTFSQPYSWDPAIGRARAVRVRLSSPDNRHVTVQLRRPGAAWQTMLADVEIPGVIPAQLKVGFAGTSGSNGMITEVRRFGTTQPLDYSVSVDDGAETGRRGQPRTWDVKVKNAGEASPERAAQVSLSSDEGLDDVTWTCSTPSGASCGSGASFAAEIAGGVPAGDTYTLRVTGRPAASASFAELTARVQNTDPALSDIDPGNDAATDRTDLRSAPPSANAGADQEVVEGSTITLDGSASTDPDGDPLSYSWKLVSSRGPSPDLTTRAGAVTQFQALDDGLWTFRLTVDDGSGDPSTDEVTVRATNQAPTFGSAELAGQQGGASVLSSTIADDGLLDRHTATVQWGDGSPAETAKVTSGAGWASLVAAHRYGNAGTYRAELTVTDDDGGSVRRELTLTAARPTSIWANATSDPFLGHAFAWLGLGGKLTGVLHSNASLKIGGLGNTVEGAIEYAKNYVRLGLGITVPQATKVAASAPPAGLAVNDFRPGGPVATELGSKYRDMSSACRFGVWTVLTPSDLLDGVYYAPCNITISALHARGRVTLVSTGKIYFFGDDSDFTPFYKGVLALSSRSGGDAIEVFGEGTRLSGQLDGRQGDVELSGAGLRLSCGVVGNRVSITGVDVRVDGADCAPPAATVADTRIVPQLSASLSVDKEAATPGDDLNYTASVTNSRTDLFVTGLVGVHNLGTTSAQVVGTSYELQYQGADRQWRTVSSSSDSREPVAVSTAAMLSPGVTYGSDSPEGTSVAAGSVAAWGYQARVRLSPDIAKLLWDPTRALAVRSVLRLMLNGDSRARELSSLGEDITGQLRARTPDVNAVTLAVAPPSGNARNFAQSTTPQLASLAPGETQRVTVSHELGAPSSRAPQETVKTYLQRLRAFDRSIARATVSARGRAGGLTVSADQQRATTERRVPVVTVDIDGASSVQTSAASSYAVAVRNEGSAPTGSLAVSSTASGGASAALTDAPTSLAAGARSNASSVLSAGSTATSSRHAVSATWTDENGNGYGSVEAAKNVTIATPPSLKVVKVVELVDDADDNQRASTGDTVEYAITTRNNGTTDLTGARVVDPVPGDLRLLASSIETTQGISNSTADQVGVDLGTLAGSSQATVRFRATVLPGRSGTRTVSIQAIATSTELAPVRSDDPGLPGLDDPTLLAVSAGAPLLNASARAEVSVDRDNDGVPSPGDSLRLRFVVQNDGDRAASGVVLRAPLGKHQTLVPTTLETSAGTVALDDAVPTARVDSLAIASRLTLTYEVRVDAAVPDDVTQLLNAVLAAANEVPGTGPAPLVTPLNITPRLKVSKTWTLAEDRDGNAAVSSGDVLGYTVAVKNPTPVSAPGTVVEDRLDSSTTLIAGSLAISQGSTAANGGVLTGTIGTLAGGATATMTYRVLVGALAAGDYDISSQASATSPGLGSSTSDDPAASGGADPTTIPVVATPAAPPSLSASKRSWVSVDADGDGKASAGDTLAYEVTITNSGAGGATGVVATDKIDPAAKLLVGSVQAPPGATVVTGNAAGDSQVKVNLGAIAAGASAAFSYQVQLSPLPAGSEAITSTGTVASNEVAPVPSGGAQGTVTPVDVPELVPPTIRILDPADGATITQRSMVRATLTPPAGQAIAEWCVYAQRVGEDDSTRKTVGCGTGAPSSAELAVFDPTTLPNGTYVLTVDATADGGGAGYASVTVVVSGALKPGRYAVSYTDMDLPIGTLPIRVTRSYDSFDKAKGDFGIGWRVGLDGFRVSVNRPLGQGGWTSRESDCLVLLGQRLCTSTDFADLRSHSVTVTWPDGRAETFDFTPSAQTGGVVLGGTAGFTPRKGATSKLRVAADPALTYLADGNLYETDQETVYNPTRFELTSTDNTRYLLDVSTGLVSSTDPWGNTLTVDDAGIHSSLGTEVLFTRDGQGRITRIDGPSGERRVYGYSPAGDLSSVTDSQGNTGRFEYDGDHNLTRDVDPAGQPSRRVEYDADGRISRIIDPFGNATSVDVSADGREEITVSPDGRLTTITTRDERGNPTRIDKVSDGQTRTMRAEFDADDNEVRSTDALGNVTTRAFDVEGNLTSETNPRGETTRYAYDAENRVTAVTTPDGKTTQLTRDAEGAITASTDPLGNVERYEYDDRGNQTAVIDPIGRTTRTTYSETGNVTTITEPDGARTTMTHDESGNPMSISAAGSRNTYVRRNPDRQVTELVDGNGGTSRFSYDRLGQRVGETDPLGRTTVIDYDALGRTTRVTDREGTVTSYEYNPQGDVVRQVSGGEVSTFAFDGAGRMVRARNVDASVDIDYDAGDQVVRLATTLESSSESFAVNYQYDAAGRRASQTYAGTSDTYAYDANGRLVTLTSSSAGTFSFGYDGAGRRIQLDRPNGVSSTYGYDAADQLISIVHANTGTTVDQSRYVYDLAGRRSSVTQFDGTRGYTYDYAGRVTGADNPGVLPDETFAYDLLGNRTNRGEQYDAANRLLSRTGFIYDWDRDGRARLARGGSSQRSEPHLHLAPCEVPR